MADAFHELIKDKRILLLSLVVLLALSLALWRGIHFGIEFEGGTRIPLSLEKAVEAYTMDEIINTVKTRTTKFGLTQVRVRGVGDSEIYVEVPKSDIGLVNEIEKLVKQQGNFEGVVDGKVAITGKEIIPSSIRPANPSTRANVVEWSIGFSVTQKGAQVFADAAKGKANYPLYMFLDRPERAVIIAPRDAVYNDSFPETELEPLLKKALMKEGASDIGLIILDENNWNATQTELDSIQNKNETKALIPDDLDNETIAKLSEMNFTIVKKTRAQLMPEVTSTDKGLSLEQWEAVGLLSSPTLQSGVTEGQLNQMYQISGRGRGASVREQYDNAQYETKKLKSILSGGAIPVQILVGSATTIPAPLGAEFLRYSILGAVVAFAAIILLIAVRYRAPRIFIPVIFVSVAELIILVCIIGGVGTIDLSAMAGIIAAMGVSVDAQIIITDEALKKEDGVETGLTHSTSKRKLGRAFEVISTNALVAILALLPLMFSGLVEIIGFATSTILGYLLGVLISRPAYGAIVEKIFLKEKNE
ncbi:hypothetical protein HY992_00605 [Candidatus Micrarchaeota archaeon]|nr:hypothetical protein [Candidatus Micrarchaeota archaeon]